MIPAALLAAALAAPVAARETLPPSKLLEAVDKSMGGKWAYRAKRGRCMQFAGEVALHVGAQPSKPIYQPQPQDQFKRADLGARGWEIAELEKAALDGRLQPGMLVHVKQHYDRDKAYDPEDDGHHWFVFVGLAPLTCRDGKVPVFADGIRAGVDRNAKGNLSRSAHKDCFAERWDGMIVDWSEVATLKQLQATYSGMTWKESPDVKCRNKAKAEGRCKGAQKVTAVYDPWAD